MKKPRGRTFYISSILFGTSFCYSSPAAAQIIPRAPAADHPATVQLLSQPGDARLRGTYKLGPDDVITVQGIDAEEFNGKPIRLDMNGQIHLPMGGTVDALGMTVPELEKEISQRLSDYYKHPDFVVNVVEFHSQPVSVLGAVKTPGIYQVQGQKTLVEMLAAAGGVRDDAGYTVGIKRRGDCPFQLPNAVVDEKNKTSSATIVMKSVVNSAVPVEDVPVCPHDEISVPLADIVYVVGEVHKAGGFVLKQNSRITALTALSMAEGQSHTASLQNARILRKQNGSAQVTQVPVDLAKIMNGKKDDVLLEPDDVLVIPNSLSKNAALRALEMGIQVGTGLVLWRGF
jgi:polysaccharide export outer membrane protein